ncbi:MAG: hypothetical protein OEZ38_02120 [Gammaproteobacteria bacterium]|nr:hypothetical protein [Gammaproteobacteria bacterium]
MFRIKSHLFERRITKRYILPHDSEIMILFSSEDPSLEAHTIKTKPIELSSTGLRIEVDYEIGIGTVLDIVVNLKSLNRDYHLTGNVRWRIPTIDNKYNIGLVLRERYDIKTDLIDWKLNFTDNFNLNS